MVSIQCTTHIWCHINTASYLSDNLKFNLHIETIVKKASSVLGFLKRNLKYSQPKVKEKAYQSLVRPKLEYSSTVWNPHQKTQIKQLEQVQRNAARWVKNEPFNPTKPTSVTNILQDLNWPTLQQRRFWTDVTTIYTEVVNSLIAIPTSYHPVLATVRSTRNSHSHKFIQYHARLNVYQFSYFPRAVVYWNCIPETCVLATSLDEFKSSIQLVPIPLMWATGPNCTV